MLSIYSRQFGLLFLVLKCHLYFGKKNIVECMSVFY